MKKAFGFAALLLALSISALAQVPRDPATVIAAQKEAMAAFAGMDGVWRGPAWTLLPSGEKHTIVQTERIGPFLGGSVKVIEGRGYNADGSVGFNALGIISFDPDTKAYTMRSYAMGHSGDFAFRPTADGYSWEIPMGPNKIVYIASIKDGKLREVGQRVVAGKEPVQFFEMNLTRIGDSDWPAAGPVPAR
jgi:hypothetical protein